MGPIKLKTLLLLLLLYFAFLGFTVIFVTPCDALDLSNKTADAKILESFDEEPDKWLLKDSSLSYISSGAKNARGSLYPEHDDNCIVYITFRVLEPDNQAWVHIEKPGGERFVKGELEIKFIKKIREVMLRELTKEYKIRLPSEVEHSYKSEHTPKKVTEKKSPPPPNKL